MEVKIGDLCYHKHMYQQFRVLAIDGTFVWMKSEDHYMTTTMSELVEEKTPLPVPENSAT